MRVRKRSISDVSSKVQVHPTSAHTVSLGATPYVQISGAGFTCAASLLCRQQHLSDSLALTVGFQPLTLTAPSRE